MDNQTFQQYKADLGGDPCLQEWQEERKALQRKVFPNFRTYLEFEFTLGIEWHTTGYHIYDNTPTEKFMTPEQHEHSAEVFKGNLASLAKVKTKDLVKWADQYAWSYLYSWTK